MKKEFKIKGMCCHSCEVVLEKEIKKIAGAKEVEASLKGKKIIVSSAFDISEQVERVVSKLGYELDREKTKTGVFFKARKATIVAFLIAATLIVFFNFLGLEKYLNFHFGAPTGILSFLVIGLVAGVSSCMVLVGGLVMGFSAKYNQVSHGKTAFQRFKPHLFFNLGRLTLFFLFGGLLAELGGFFMLNAGVVGAMILIFSFVMLVLGLSLLGLTTRFQRMFKLPRGLGSFFEKIKKTKYSHQKAFFVGGATFFLPCGFTQAAQLFAISSGSFLIGALVMFFFALGTTPGLLGIGGRGSVFKKGFRGKVFFKTVGFLMIFFAIYNFLGALNLVGVNPEKIGFLNNETEVNREREDERTRAEIIDGVQVIKTVYDPENRTWRYVIYPNEFKLVAGVPARLEISSTRDGYDFGCRGSITLPGLNDNLFVFRKDQVVSIDFFPKKPGFYEMVCAAGSPMGSILVSF